MTDTDFLNLSDDKDGLNLDTYLFPDEDLQYCSIQELRDHITENLATALDQVDGISSVREEHIDLAQDIIEQCRDRLLARGESFSDEERGTLSFLRWPLTPAEEAAKHAREEAVLAERRARWVVAQQKAVDLVTRCLQGEAQEDELQHCELTVHLNEAPGLEAIKRANLLESFTGQKPFLAYVCSRAGVTLETDPGLRVSMSVKLSTSPQMWETLKAWRQEGQVWSFEFWGQSEFAKVDCFHHSVTNLFPSVAERPKMPDSSDGESFVVSEDPPAGAAFKATPSRLERFLTLVGSLFNRDRRQAAI
jgi:hypothetical protein